MGITEPDQQRERRERLHTLYTGVVADILDQLGYRNQCLPADIRPLDRAMKVAGLVYTVRGRARHADDGVDPRYKQMEMLENIVPGGVVVIHPGDESSAAHWGELMSNIARARGATGTVIAGGLRDSQQILDIGYPVFCRYHSPLTAVWRWDITDFNIPLEIGRVAVRPGDFVLGDIDGILIIPGDIVDRVIERAEEVRDKESVVRERLRHGADIRALFEQYRVL